MVRSIFTTEPELCTGCRICELVCALNKTGELNTYRARLKIVMKDDLGIFSPIICRHCVKPACFYACPVPGAMVRDHQTGVVSIREDKCIGCRACADACPFGAIRLDPEGNPCKCDLCGGDPLCVHRCPPRPLESLPNLPPQERSCLQYKEFYRAGKDEEKQLKRDEKKSHIQ